MTQTTDTPDPLAIYRQRRRRLVWRILLALVIFVAGAATGSGLTVVGMVNRFQHTMRHPETLPPRMAAEMKRRLNLTDQQAAQVQAILAQRQVRLQAIRQRVEPEVLAQFNETHDEIARLLTPEQEEKWNTWFENLKSRWLTRTPATQPEK